VTHSCTEIVNFNEQWAKTGLGVILSLFGVFQWKKMALILCFYVLITSL